jgi:predicted membrane protein
VRDRSPQLAGRFVAGAILIVLGVLFLLDNLDVLNAREVLRFWPLILIALGLTRLLAPRRPEDLTGAVVLLFLGGVFLLRTLHVPWFRLRSVWPLLLVLIGGMIIWQGLRGRSSSAAAPPPPGPLPDPAPESPKPPEPGPSERAAQGALAGLVATRGLRAGAEARDSVLSEFALMGGGELVVHSQDFRGGEVTAIMGGFEIDLRGAAIAGDSATIEIFTLFGGIELKVPQEWYVVLQGTPILGMFANTAKPRPESSAPRKTLILKGAAIMGGVEVKN